eukprot:scaffold257446_cov36-Tisochrysis_lutea.AAC.1
MWTSKFEARVEWRSGGLSTSPLLYLFLTGARTYQTSWLAPAALRKARASPPSSPTSTASSFDLSEELLPWEPRVDACYSSGSFCYAHGRWLCALALLSETLRLLAAGGRSGRTSTSWMLMLHSPPTRTGSHGKRFG